MTSYAGQTDSMITKEEFSAFCEKEGITWRMFLSPLQVYRLLVRHRALQFFVVGSCGVGINLGITWLLTTFVFGLQNYFLAYLFGITANLSFNFTLYTLAIFKTRERHARRLIIFVLYSLTMASIQATIVRTVTPLVGIEWYLGVSAGTIFMFSIFNFFVFKLSIFRRDGLPRV